MKKLVSAAILFGGVGVSILGGSQPARAHSQNFLAALAKAYKTNPSIQAQRAGVRQADEAVNQAYAGWKPTIDGTITGTKTHIRPSQRNPFVSSNVDQNYEERTGQAQLRGSYNIFRGWRTVNATSSAISAVYAARAELVIAEQEVLLAAITAYVDTVTSTRVVASNKSNVNVLKKQLEATQVRVKVGDLTKSNAFQVQADVEDARARLNTAQAQLELAKANYKRIIGGQPSDLKMPHDLPKLPMNVDAAKKIALDQNPAIVQAKFQEKASKSDIRTAMGALAPSLDVNGTVGRNKTFRPPPTSGTPRGSHTDSMSVSASLTVPIYNAGTNHSQIRSAHQVATQRRLNLEVVKRRVMEEVTRAWEQLDTARANKKKFQAKKKAAHSALEGIREEQRVGSRTTLEVLDAEQKYFEAQVQHIQEVRNEIIAAYTLMSNMGQLTSRQLNLQVDHYNPDVHYKNTRFKPLGLTAGKSGEPSGNR